MKPKSDNSCNWVREQPLSFWVKNDARSANAWLRNKGDGRVEIYSMFAWLQTILHGCRDLEEINSAFCVFSKRRENLPQRVVARFYSPF